MGAMLRGLVGSWLAQFIVLQAIAISCCWAIFRVPMYCVYGSYAAIVMYVNICRWPSTAWLCLNLPTRIHDNLSQQSFEEQDCKTLNELHASKKVEALFLCNGRANDTRELADHIHEAFFLKSVVYILLVFAIAVSTGMAYDAHGDKEVAPLPILHPSDWFKAVVLFVVLVMGLLWDASVCFYQRMLNERCHQFLVLMAAYHRQSQHEQSGEPAPPKSPDLKS